MMSLEQFAQAVIEALRAAGLKGKIEYIRSEFELRFDDGDPKTALRMNLGHAYNEYLAAPNDRKEEVVACYVKVTLTLRNGSELPSDYATIMPRLGLAVWSAADVELRRCVAELEGHSPQDYQYACRPLTEDLFIAPVYDDGTCLWHLRECDLQNGETAEVALRDATLNLAKKGTLMDQIGSVFCVQTDDSYDAARIVLVEMLRKLPVKGELVALVPDRDCLIIAGSADVDGLAQMVEMGLDRFHKRSRVISGRPVVLEGSRWTRFTPPKQVGEAFAQLARQYEGLDYHQQAHVLRKLSAKRGDNALVANVVWVPSRTGEGFATTTGWVRGIPTLLPKVDVVAFVDRQTGIPAVVSWDDVVRVVSHRMQATGDVPPRYRVESYPTPAEMEAMGAEEIRPAPSMQRPTFRPH